MHADGQFAAEFFPSELYNDNKSVDREWFWANQKSLENNYAKVVNDSATAVVSLKWSETGLKQATQGKGPQAFSTPEPKL